MRGTGRKREETKTLSSSPLPSLRSPIPLVRVITLVFFSPQETNELTEDPLEILLGYFILEGGGGEGHRLAFFLRGDLEIERLFEPGYAFFVEEIDESNFSRILLRSIIRSEKKEKKKYFHFCSL